MIRLPAIPRDKLLHLALGIIAIVCVMVALVIYGALGLGACLATLYH
jgi:hypothetical protein